MTTNTEEIVMKELQYRNDSSSSSVPFPSTGGENASFIPDSGSSSSNLTSSDKLSALPAIQSSPTLGLHRTATRGIRRSLEASASLPALESSNSPGLKYLSKLPPTPSRASESEGSQGKDTPKQRVSFDSDRGSLPATLQGFRQAVANRVSQRNDSTAESSDSHPRLRINHTPRGKDGASTPVPDSRSPSQSRAASPLRFFGWNLHRTHSRDEPFIPVDPFKLPLRFFASPASTPRRSSIDLLDIHCDETCTSCLPFPIQCTTRRRTFKARSCGRGIRAFLVDIFPRHIYLHLLFRLPALYFSRVSRIFEDAEVSKHEIHRLIAACAPATEADESGVANTTAGASGIGAGLGAYRTPGQRGGGSVFPFPADWTPPSVSPALARFKHSWEQFVDSLLREWKTLNLVSVLLCTALLTMFQIQDAAGDPLTRWAALFSLIFAIMSLTYGCIYIVQFGSMRSMYKASRWAEEGQKTKTAIWWNIWVLLAMPAIWLAWSMTAFCVAILSYVWRTGSSSDPSDGIRAPLSPEQAVIVRTILTVIFGIGLIYFILILRTFSSYGEREAGWRRSWLATGHPTLEERARRDAAERARGRSRDRELNRDRTEREAAPDRGSDEKPSPVMGLGLSGMSASPSGLASMSGVLREEANLDPGDGKRREEYTGRGRISPKL